MQVVLYSNATKGEGYLDTSKSDLAVSLKVQRIRVVALFLFVTHILNYVKQLQVPEVTVEPDKISEKISDVAKTPPQVCMFHPPLSSSSLPPFPLFLLSFLFFPIPILHLLHVYLSSLTHKDSAQPEPSPDQEVEVQKRIKLNVSIRAPEITVPLNSQTTDIVVLDLGQLTLENEFHLIDLGTTPGQNKALYEQYQVKLTDLEMYR